jgi:hypothetical protein
MIVKHGTKRDSHSGQYMSIQLIQAMLIGFFASALYVAVDKVEPDRRLATLFKYLVVMWGAGAIIHCSGLFGYGFF